MRTMPELAERLGHWLGFGLGFGVKSLGFLNLLLYPYPHRAHTLRLLGPQIPLHIRLLGYLDAKGYRA